MHYSGEAYPAPVDREVRTLRDKRLEHTCAKDYETSRIYRRDE
jgi:hypothetical protein